MLIEDIKNIDVLHASLDSDGELVDNFAIVDNLLKRIEELEAALKEIGSYNIHGWNMQTELARAALQENE